MDTRTRRVHRVRVNHRRKDLLFHVWPSNTLYIRLEKQCPEGLTFDLSAGTWSFDGHTFPIGETAGNSLRKGSFYPKGTPYGVYDRMKLKHLRRMIEVHENLASQRGGAISLD